MSEARIGAMLANVFSSFEIDLRDEAAGTITRDELVSATADRLELLAELGYTKAHAELAARARAAGVEVPA
jgi:hypothetical protein